MSDKFLQIGDLCPQCKSQKLVYVGSNAPYSEEYLWCSEDYETGIGCNSTFSIKYKQMWAEDVNSLTVKLIDVIEDEFKKRNMTLSDEKSDELFDNFQEMLEQFSTGDYKNYN